MAVFNLCQKTVDQTPVTGLGSSLKENPKLCVKNENIDHRHFLQFQQSFKKSSPQDAKWD